MSVDLEFIRENHRPNFGTPEYPHAEECDYCGAGWPCEPVTLAEELRQSRDLAARQAAALEALDRQKVELEVALASIERCLGLAEDGRTWQGIAVFMAERARAALAQAAGAGGGE